MEKWLGISSLVLVLVVGWTVWDDSQQEWVQYQKAYYRVALRLAKSEAQKEWARDQRTEIRQLQIKETGMIERCVTCHSAYDNPMFRNFSEPLRTHSALVKSHPPERFGCVACHGGEGRAVTTVDAHGHGNVRAKPLLKGDYLQAACYNCHGANTLPPQATAAVSRGKQLVNRSFCLGCHKIGGEGGEEGPDLSTVGSNRSWLWIYAHTARPQGVVAGSTMPVFSLGRDEIQDITVYLMTLLNNRDRLRYLPLLAKRVVKDMPSAKRALIKEGQKETKRHEIGSPIEFHYDGKALFEGLGCSLCHTIGITGGEVGPPLTYIARKRDAENLERLLSDPERVLPGGKMPQLYLNDAQIKGLVRYLSRQR